MDIIFIHELRIDTLVGVYAWERRHPQTIELNLEIGTHAARAAKTGKIVDTIDYSKVVGRIREQLAEGHVVLVESIAERIAAMVLAEFGAPWVRVSVAKLAPLAGVRKLGITIERGTKEG